MIDPTTWAFGGAAVAALIIGLAKGGFGGVGTVIAVPVMSLGTDPKVTLGVLLPILMMADVVSVGSHWRNVDRLAVRQAVPGALFGVALGAALLSIVDGAVITLAIGVISVVFALHSLWRSRGGQGESAGPIGHPRFASLFGGLSGLTSTLAHSGGPPIHMHLLARGYSPLAFVATASVFMASLNLMKLLPYLLIGTLDTSTLWFSFQLAPFVVLAACAGVWVARRIERRLFSLVVNLLMLLIGARLCWGGLRALTA